VGTCMRRRLSLPAVHVKLETSCMLPKKPLLALAAATSAPLPLSPAPRLSRLVCVLNVNGSGQVNCFPECFLRAPLIVFLDSREAGATTACPERIVPQPVPLLQDGLALHGCPPPCVGSGPCVCCLLGPTRRRNVDCNMAPKNSFAVC